MIRLSAFADEAANELNGQIAALVRNDIGYIEIRGISGTNIKDITHVQAKEIYNQLDSNGIKVWSIGSPIGKVSINENFESYLDVVKKLCETANVLRTDKMRVFSFFDAYDCPDKVYEYLSRMVETASGYGVELYHENEKDIFGDTAARVEKVLDNVKGLKSVFDPANFLQVDEDVSVAYDKLFYRTDYFHIKDVISATKEIVPAGHGDGKIDNMIKNINKDVVLTLEPHLAIFDGFKSIDKRRCI